MTITPQPFAGETARSVVAEIAPDELEGAGGDDSAAGDAGRKESRVLEAAFGE